MVFGIFEVNRPLSLQGVRCVLHQVFCWLGFHRVLFFDLLDVGLTVKLCRILEPRLLLLRDSTARDAGGDTIAIPVLSGVDAPIENVIRDEVSIEQNLLHEKLKAPVIWPLCEIEFV